ncbi:amino acid ABC transporter ATP-binding protein [Variovorax boronicumulans]|uniref:amino acid ABC transporter ATP-binding protein n=2 Tax=Variovorax boronicumulans TaxID=436515 RepID=UPI00085C82EE|nr:amino acid ABC transporter ATP-binding protein [Variovorax boronicumulans]OEZ27377.1 arginine ABC transporter ATP-binding protein [Variovorax boronicumulans]
MTTPTSRPFTQAVRMVGVTKYRATQAVLRDVSFDVSEGQVVAVLGPSGAGKSTLLRCINHLETIDGGKIFVSGELIGYRERGDALIELPDSEISRQRRRIGMVFQSFNLFRHITVLDNVMAGPVHVLGQTNAQARALAMELLSRVGLAEKAGAYPNQLSGGQQQRVAIARALALKPRLMLLDEPTSALDPELSHEVIAAIRQLALDGITLMIATHEMSLARDFAHRVLFMVNGELVEDRPARDFFQAPRHERSKQFLAHHADAPASLDTTAS